MLLLVRTVVEAPTEGWGAPITIGSFALVAALLATFVTIELRSAAPLVRLGILRSGPLLRANLGGMILFGSYFGFQFVGTLYLQAAHGWSALETALAFLPAGMLVAFGAPRLGPLVDRFGTARIIAAGAVSLLAGYVLFLRLDDSPSYVGLMLPTMLLLGIGFALSFPALNIQAVAGVADHEQGLASGLLNTSFQVGGAVNLAVVSAVVSTGSGGIPSLDGFQTAIAVVVGVAVLGLAIAASAFAVPVRDRVLARAEA
jgi:Na+/melibiose symporter-like transporter